MERVARCWREFLTSSKTTLQLAKNYQALKMNSSDVSSMLFDHLASHINSPATLRTVKALLDRLETRYRAVLATNCSSSLVNIDHLLKRVNVATPTKMKRTSSFSAKDANKLVTTLARYPVRVVLCAYMITAHPEDVFSCQGEREMALSKSAQHFIYEFESLIRVILKKASDNDSVPPQTSTLRSQILNFDTAWCIYLNCFVVWKVKDAQSLEDDLVRVACQLELSMLQKCNITEAQGETDALHLSHDLQAIRKQVEEDHRLLREKILLLTGVAGIQRMDSALSETRSEHFRSMTKASPTISSSNLDSQMDTDKIFIAESNELIINELLHELHSSFVDVFKTSEEENSIRTKIRMTMEEAYWDSISESIKQDEPKYERVVDLLGEVKDGITEMAPENWKQEIAETIDLDIFSQLLNSGALDMDYLRKILDFAIAKLIKLSSPAHEDEMKVTHQELLQELAKICQTEDESKSSHDIAMIKGLRYVLEQIQHLKQETSKARTKMMEPLLKGPAGFNYLREAFTNRHGSPSNACASLPFTLKWITSLKSFIDDEWKQHRDCISPSIKSDHLPQTFVPSTVFRTGESFMIQGKEVGGSSAPNTRLEPVRDGDQIDLIVRLGLLKFVYGESGITKEDFPETLMLNFSRLRAVWAQVKNMIVACISLLICRQYLLMEQIVASREDMEGTLLNRTQKLLELLDSKDDVSMEEIARAICSQDHNKAIDHKSVVASTLTKSLEVSHPIYVNAKKIFYVALRTVLLGGTPGRKAAETELAKIGASTLCERTLDVAKTLIVAATVSISIHKQWYIKLIDNM